MSFPAVTAALSKPRSPMSPPGVAKGDGGVMYDIDHHLWRGDGFNSVPPGAGVYTIDFGTVGILAPGAKATVTINEGSNGIPVTITNPNTTSPMTGPAVANEFANHVNGGLGVITPGALRGYSATNTPGQPVVTLKGKPGLVFNITTEGFSPSPTVTQAIAAVCPGVLPYGRAVVQDLAKLPDRRPGSSIADANIVSLPTGSATAVLVGLSVSDVFGTFENDQDCCGNEELDKTGYECHDCAHYLRLEPGNPQLVKVTLEVPLAGDTAITQPINTPIFYRETGVAGAPNKGTLSVGAPVGDTNRKLFRSAATGAQLVIRGVIDKATRQYYVGVNV